MTGPVKFCICGGGNLAHALVAVLGSLPYTEVSLLTRSPARWGSRVRLLYQDELELFGRLTCVSSDPSEVIPDANVIILSLPSFARRSVLRGIYPFIKETAWVGSIPGWGGFDWEARQELGRAFKIFGVHRTPYICRVVDYGESVYVSGVSPELFLSAIPRASTEDISALIKDALNIPVVRLDNYLSVTLTPSNSVCHPVRLYSLFSEWEEGIFYEREFLFYEEWDELASEMFIKCDRELQNICRALPLDMSWVPPILKHYRAATATELTQRMRGIRALKGIHAPLRETLAGFVPDLDSRFFTEDIPYGMFVIRCVGQIAGVPTPTFDHIINWSQKLLGVELLSPTGDVGAGATETLPLPQNFGIFTVEELARRAML